MSSWIFRSIRRRPFLALCVSVLVYVSLALAQPSVPPSSDGAAPGSSVSGFIDGDGATSNTPPPASAPTTRSRINSAPQTRIYTAGSPESTVLISEFRLSGPLGTADEFIELYNNTGTQLDVTGWTLTAGATSVTLSGIIVGRGHLLVTGTGYSLSSYSTGDQTLPQGTDIPLGATLTLRSTGGTLIDEVNAGGALLPATAVQTTQYSFVRRGETGLPLDTDSDSNDFNLVSTTVTAPSPGPTGVNTLDTNGRLGAPGPQGRTSPAQRNNWISGAQFGSTNTSRLSTTGTTSLDPLGRIALRRTITNVSVPAGVTRFRFRAAAVTAGGGSAASGNTNTASDVRLISSSIPAAGTLINGQLVLPAILESPSDESSAGNGGGLNTSWTVDLPPAVTFNPGQSINVEFIFGVVKGGPLKVVIDTEPDWIPTPTPTPTPTPSSIDATINTGPNTGWVGAGIANTTAQNQAVTQSSQAGVGATYFVSVKRAANSAAAPIHLTVPGYTDFVQDGGSAHFFLGTTSNEITSDITTAAGWSTDLASGAETLVRVELAAPAGTTRSLLIQVQDDGTTPAASDAVKATLAVASLPPTSPSSGPYLERIEWSRDSQHWQTYAGFLPLLKNQSIGLRAVAHDPVNHPWDEVLPYVPTWSVRQAGQTQPTIHLGEMVWVQGTAVGSLSFSATCGRSLSGALSVAFDPDDDEEDATP